MKAEDTVLVVLEIAKQYGPISRAMEIEAPLRNELTASNVGNVIGGMDKGGRDENGRPYIGNAVIDCVLSETEKGLEIMQLFLFQLNLKGKISVRYKDELNRDVILHW